ncbi:hypothetical protein M3Y99_00591800 [Aphelenchoides fujianensis]|nr:hypothetical protein M3Y99_00591800 [Aphelenchoides fujianensis]
MKAIFCFLLLLFVLSEVVLVDAGMPARSRRTRLGVVRVQRAAAYPRESFAPRKRFRRGGGRSFRPIGK